jgi:poly(3-hydroxybutyrate) depolymerase
VFLAGLSAGGAMAAILAATYPDVFATVAVQSGVPHRSTTSVAAAFTAMKGGDANPVGGGRAVHAAMGDVARPVPGMVVHGSADQTVAPVNADRLLE